MDKKTITTIVVLIALVVLGFFGWQKWNSEKVVEENDASTLFTAEAPVNPFAESVNPYANIKTNPFE